MPNHKNLFHSDSIENVLAYFNTNIKGLSQIEAEKRLLGKGLNALTEKKKFSTLTLFLRQFQNPLIYILIFAMVLSFVITHISDGVIIGVVIVVTNIIGFIQEFKANKALEQLNSTIVYKAKVLRNGKLEIIKQEEIVCGDIIEIAPGDIVPADARLIDVNDLTVFEASLTGESYPSNKSIDQFPLDAPLADRENMVYQGTAVNEGTAKAVVVATGDATEIGKIASMIREADSDLTPLQKQINTFGKWLGMFLVGINIVICTFGILMGRPFFEMFMVAVVIVVSAVPEGLIPAMTIILALGMQKLIKKKGLVRKIISAETLGSVSVICTDKTGTLTEGKMAVDSIITASQKFHVHRQGNTIEDCDHSVLTALKIGAISNNAIVEHTNNSKKTGIVGNATEKALLLAGVQFGYSREELELTEERIDEMPFSSDKKLMATLHRSANKQNILYMKGAPERVLPLCAYVLDGENEVPMSEKELENIMESIDSLTGQGQRMLAVAYKKNGMSQRKEITDDDICGLVFVGIFALKDKIRVDAAQAIEMCEHAGIRVVMITGDHAKTAVSIARELGLDVSMNHVLEGGMIDGLSDEELRSRVNNVVVYARVEPKHKLRIATMLQDNGEVIAMIGDGINDAPALKKADIGVVMGNGTNVAKEVADLVLLDSRFMTIVEAVKQGRNTFNNIRKVIVYLFTDCFQELVIVGTAVLLNWPLPINPVQILWIKLIESPLPATSLSFEESEVDVMKDKPRHRNEHLLSKKLKINILFYALVMDVFALSIFYMYWKIDGDIVRARTVIFVALGMSTLFMIYAVRSLRRSIFTVNPFKNVYLVIATIIGFILFLAAVYLKFLNQVLETTPLSLRDWLIIIAYAGTAIIVFEAGKIFSKMFCGNAKY
jgi:P-type Ca2+ transporter type 2C